MKRRVHVRAALFAPAGLVVLGTLAWAFAGVPDFGHPNVVYGALVDRLEVAQRHTSNIVVSVVFDYRGLDTLGEELILFASATGVAMLLRASVAMEEQRPRDIVTHEATRLGGILLLPVLLVLGLWLVTFGYVTPGGGFQGGVVLAGALLMTWTAGSYRDFRETAPMTVVDGVEGVGAGGYVLVGVATLATSGYFLRNVLPLGTAGSLASSGTIAVLNWLSALAVAAANVVIFQEFLKHYVGTLPGQAAD